MNLNLTSSTNIKELKEKRSLKIARETRNNTRATKRHLDFCLDEAFEDVFDNNDKDGEACIYCNELFSLSKACAKAIRIISATRDVAQLAMS